jgi:hypothetical protein
MKEEIEALKVLFLEVEAIFEEGDDDHQLIYDLEEKIQNASYEIGEEHKEAAQLDKLNKRVQEFKRENNFFNAEAELDRMFPDRHDPDFDDDSMSYDSVFGDD